MSTSVRHFTAIGLTTALAFGVFQHFVELLINTRPGHPTTWDMILFILTTFFGPLAVASFVMFPIVTAVGRLHGKWRVARAISILLLPIVIPVILWLLMTLISSSNELLDRFVFAFLALGWAFAGSILFCVLFYFYCSIIFLEWFTSNLSHRFKHRPNNSLQTTAAAPASCD
jgi:hypothetical protein